MKQCLRLCLLAAAVFCAAPQPAPAQMNRSPVPLRPPSRVSHVPIEGGVSTALADQFLQNRLEYAELQRLLSDLAEHPEKAGIDDPEDRNTITNALKKKDGQPDRLLEDPEVRKIIGKAADRLGKKSEFTPEERQRWEELARRYLPKNDPPVDPGKPGGTPVKPGEPPVPPPGGPDQPPDAGKPSTSGPPPTDPEKPKPPPSPPAHSPMDDHMRDIAEWVADSRLADSPAFRRMVANLDRVKAPNVPGGRDWDRRLEQIERRFSTLGTRLPNLSWPKVDYLPRDPADRRHPIPEESVDVTGGGNPLLFVLVAVAAVGLFIGVRLRRPGLVLLRRRAGGWRLGPWPVRPEAVRTRDELVRAFEYLALLLLGPAALTRNHEEIAADLGEQDEDRRAAAARLAGLYEQARYAPPDEALPDTDLVAARADLSLLAGVAAA
jgi:hypothetical protein